MKKRILSLLLTLVMVVSLLPLNVIASDLADTGVENVNDAPEANTPENGEENAVPTLPNAEVKNLGAITVKDNEGREEGYGFNGSYHIYNGSLTKGTEPFDLAIAMQFIAKDTVEEAAKNFYGNYTTDFFITMTGIKDGSFVADGCYLAGYYPSYGAWVQIPLDGFEVEDGKVYPVITSAGFDFKYTDICSSVKDFICGIYLTPDVLAANPNIKVKLTLGLSENKDAALEGNFVEVDGYEYDAKDLIPVQLPEVLITDIKGTLKDSDPDLTFALNFAIKDADKLAEDYLDALFERYGDWYVDYVMTISGLTSDEVVFNANGDADGYLAGQYDAWSENWVSVPFDDVTVKNGESLYIMEYAAKLMNQSGLRFTLAEIAEIVQNFDCGVYFTPEFLAANPGLTVTLSLVVFEEDEAGNKEFAPKFGLTEGATNVFKVPSLPEVEITDIKASLTENDPDLTFALNFAIKGMENLTKEYLDELFAYYGDWYVDYVLTISGLTSNEVVFNANGNANGYLAGQYDAWSENWVTVPFDDVKVENGQSLYIMEYAAKLMGKSGLRFTLEEIATIVQNFDCGVYFTPEFLAANPGLTVTLSLVVFEEDEAGKKTFAPKFGLGDVAKEFTAEALAPKTYVAQIGETKYETLAEAIAAVADSATVTLLRDITLNDTIVIPAGKTITLDLNGKTITGTPTEAKAYAVIENKGDLTITGGGKIVCDHKLAGSTGYAVNTIVNGGKLTINGATIENKSTASNQIGYAIDNNSTTGNATVVIKSGKVTASGSNYYDGIRLFANSTTFENSVTVEGGEISTIWMQNPSDGADVKNTKDVKASVVISGGEVGGLYLEPSASFEASISGGAIGTVSYFQTAEGRDLTGFITGGTFTCDPTEWVAEGFVAQSNGDGSYGVEKDPAYGKVAQIGDKYYETFSAAIAAAQAGDTIVLLSDILCYGEIAINKSITIDGNGFSFIADESYTGWYTGKKYNVYPLAIKADNVTLKDVVVDCKKLGKGLDILAYDNIVLDNVTVKNEMGNAININGANVILRNRITSTNIIGGGKGYSLVAEDGVILDVRTISFQGTADYANTNLDGALKTDGTSFYLLRILDTSGNLAGYANSLPTRLTDGYTYKLLGNITQNDNVTLAWKDSFSSATIDLNGKTLTLKVGKIIAVLGNLFIKNEGSIVGNIELAATEIAVYGSKNLTVRANAGVPDNYYVSYKNGAYSLVEITYAAEVNGVKYETLQAAINAAQDGETIKIIANIDLVWDGTTKIDNKYAAIACVVGKAVTIDLNGHQLTGNSETWSNGTNVFAVFAADEGGSLTLKDSVGNASVKVTGTSKMYCLMMAYEPGTKLIVEGGSYSLDNASDSLIYSGSSEIVVINGGNFHLGNVGTGTNGKPWIFNAYGNNNNHVLVNGGTFNADVAHQFWRHEAQFHETKALKNNGNGTWTVVDAEAYIVEDVVGYGYIVGYATVQEALAAAKSGEVVKLVKDSVATIITVINGATLDLNGKTLTATYLVAFKGSFVTDSSENKDGLLIIDKDNLVYHYSREAIQARPDFKPTLPIYNGVNGYKFATMQMNLNKTEAASTVTNDSIEMNFRVSFGSALNYLLADGAADNAVKIIVRMTWTDQDGNTISQDFVYSEELIKNVYNSTKGNFTFTSSGLSTYENMQITYLAVSDTGVSVQGYVFDLTEAPAPEIGE